MLRKLPVVTICIVAAGLGLMVWLSDKVIREIEAQPAVELLRAHEAQERAGDHAAALATARALVQEVAASAGPDRPPSSVSLPQALLLLARSQVRNDDWAGAETALRAALSEEVSGYSLGVSVRRHVRHRLAVVLAEQGRHREAIPLLEQVAAAMWAGALPASDVPTIAVRRSSDVLAPLYYLEKAFRAVGRDADAAAVADRAADYRRFLDTERDYPIDGILGLPEDLFYTLVQLNALIVVALLLIVSVIRPLVMRMLEGPQEVGDVPQPEPPPKTPPNRPSKEEAVEQDEEMDMMIDKGIPMFFGFGAVLIVLLAAGSLVVMGPRVFDVIWDLATSDTSQVEVTRGDILKDFWTHYDATRFTAAEAVAEGLIARDDTAAEDPMAVGDRVESRTLLARARVGGGDLVAAEPPLREALTLLLQADRGEEDATAAIQHSLGALLAEQGRDADAVPYLAQAVMGLWPAGSSADPQSRFEDERRYALAATVYLEQALRATGAVVEAEDLAERTRSFRIFAADGTGLLSNNILGIPRDRFYQMMQLMALVIVSLLVVFGVVLPLIVQATRQSEDEA